MRTGHTLQMFLPFFLPSAAVTGRSPGIIPGYQRLRHLSQPAVILSCRHQASALSVSDNPNSLPRPDSRRAPLHTDLSEMPH